MKGEPTPHEVPAPPTPSRESLLSTVFEHAAIGMGRVRFHDACWLDVNDAFCAMLGYTRDELLRTPWPRITHPDDVDLDLLSFREMAAGRIERYSVEKRFIHKAGHPVWARLTLSLVRDALGRPDYEIAVIENITDRKLAEERLRESEERYRAVVEQAADPFFLHDFEGRILDVNRRACESLGYTREELLAMSVPDFQQDFDLPAVKRLWAHLDRESPITAVGHHRRKDGRVFPVEVRIAAIEVRGRRTIVAVPRDITDRIRMEADLREADRRKNEFLAVLSHELRNPLAPIRNCVHILERAPPGAEQARRALAIIDRQVTHMARLIEDLLDVTRISRGKIRLACEPVALAEIVRAAADDLREQFHRAGVLFEVDVPDEPLCADVDRTRVAQVVGNLLQNAVKFTPPGGHVWLSLRRSAASGEAHIEVRDDGAGVCPELLPRLFEPFVQADQTLDRSPGGLGLGLALVKGLVELHGGTVGAASAGPGRGATFTVRLPIGECHAGTVPPERA